MSPKRPQTLSERLVELRDLVVEYVKSELSRPVAQLGRWIGYGLASAACLAFATAFLVLATVRGLQVETGSRLSGNWSWVPYLAGMLVAAISGVFMWLAMRRAVNGRLGLSQSPKHGDNQL